MTQMAKRYGARVIIDGAQSVAHIPVNVQQLGADFFVFSGHKIFGPTGIGAVLHQGRTARHPAAVARRRQHDPQRDVRRNDLRRSAGQSSKPARPTSPTPSAWGRARLRQPPRPAEHRRLRAQAARARDRAACARSTACGSSARPAKKSACCRSCCRTAARKKSAGCSNQEGIAVRAGHHCSQPSLRRFGVESTVRPSLSFYNTHDEIDRLVDAVEANPAHAVTADVSAHLSSKSARISQIMKLVIVGGVAGGASAAARARRLIGRRANRTVRARPRCFVRKLRPAVSHRRRNRPSREAAHRHARTAANAIQS